MRRIFISHSTKIGDDLGRNYVTELVSGLADVKDEKGDQRFEVFYDRYSLEGGDDWNRKIVNHLIYCHAAVLILSPRALDSEFVKFEVSNLMARRAREFDPQTNQPSFLVIPVLPWIPGSAASPQAFKADMVAKLNQGFWGAIGFTAGINFLGPADAATVVPELLTKLADVGDSLPDDSFARLERHIATYLENVKPVLLEAAADAIGVSAPPAGATREEQALHVTRALLLSPLDDVFKALQEMQPSLKETVKDVFDLLAPSWVSPEAARLVAEPLGRIPRDCCLVVNGEQLDFTPEMYVRRARGRPRKAAGKIMQLHEPVSALNDFDELKRRVRELLRDRVPAPGNIDDPGYPAVLVKQLNTQSKLMPHVVAMPLSSEAMVPLLLKLSRVEEFASVLFVGLSGDLPFQAAGDKGLVRLTPELRPEQESDAKTLYDGIVDAIT